MNKLSGILFILLISIMLLPGCDENPAAPETQREVSVFGFLWGNQPLSEDHAILISYTEPVLEYYDLNKAAIRDATVTIREESAGTVTTLQHSSSKPGYYYNDNLMIHPKSTYDLRIELKDGNVVTAKTTVPAEITLLTELHTDQVNTVTYKNLGYDKPILVNCESEDQIILVDMYCNETYDKAEYIYPFNNHNFPDDDEEYDQGANGEPRHIFALVPYRDMKSPQFNNLPVIYWYYSMIVFYGSNTMQVLAIDENYHQYHYKEHPEQSGGIVGGIGVFGSVVGETYQLDVVKE
ncbi:hypothetical protein JW960_18995 [candidate division KSB1 bacterium]|nr:hypothetical protein [candidate division KSB1 bacterium]